MRKELIDLLENVSNLLYQSPHSKEANIGRRAKILKGKLERLKN